MSLTRDTNRYAQKLPVYNAHMNLASIEYVVGSLPFYIRWFVRFDKIEGNKRKDIEQVKLVAQYGTHCEPFARILLAVEAALDAARAREASTSHQGPGIIRLLTSAPARRITAAGGTAHACGLVHPQWQAHAADGR